MRTAALLPPVDPRALRQHVRITMSLCAASRAEGYNVFERLFYSPCKSPSTGRELSTGFGFVTLTFFDANRIDRPFDCCGARLSHKLSSLIKDTHVTINNKPKKPSHVSQFRPLLCVQPPAPAGVRSRPQGSCRRQETSGIRRPFVQGREAHPFVRRSPKRPETGSVVGELEARK